MGRTVVWVAAAVLGASCQGSTAPAGPTPSPNPRQSQEPLPGSPPPTSGVRLQMSGRVLDQNGAPLSGATVEVDYPSAGGVSNPPSQCPSMAQFCWLSMQSNNLGEYAVEFEPRPWPGRGSGYVYAFRDGYEVDVQWVPAGPSPVVRDLTLRASRTISAGESIAVAVAPTSSLCTDLEDLWAMEARCEIVLIESAAGTLNVEARAVSGGPAPSMYWYTTGNYAGPITRPAPGTVSIPAGGGTYRVLLAIPEGAAAQEFNVTASLR